MAASMKAFQAVQPQKRPVRIACAALPDNCVPSKVAAVAKGVAVSAFAAAALLSSAPTAVAISGGKDSMGIFKPLDDADLSGKDLRRVSFTKGALRRVKFDGADLSGVSIFGAFCKDCSFIGANMRVTDLESADVEGADFSNAVLEGAMVTNTQFKRNKITNSDWTDVNLRKDQYKYLCSIAEGVNPETGVDTRESLNCP